MRRALSYLLPLLVAFIALIPPIKFRIPAPTEQWPLLIAVAGFLGIRIFFVKTNPIVKIAAILPFISCFFSSVPYMSWNSYVVIVAHLWLYVGLTKMSSWKPMFATVKTLLVYNSIIIFFQLIGHDQMLNWSLDTVKCFGVTGQHMQMGSYSVVLTCLLLIVSPAFLAFPIIVSFFCNSAWTLFCAGAGIFTLAYIRKSTFILSLSFLLFLIFFTYALSSGKFSEALSQHSGRLTVWAESIQLLNDKPFTGYGPGTYKGVYGALSRAFFHRTSNSWLSAHNDYIQFAFEFGYPISIIVFSLWILIFLILFCLRRYQGADVLITGFVMLSLDMLVHFPTRLAELCPLIVAFLAYLTCWINKKKLDR